MYAILRQAIGVVIGGMIVAAMTLAPRVSANDEIIVTSLQAPVTIAETNQSTKSMTYQGMLLNANGLPVQPGDYSMVFSIYSAEKDGQQLWTHTIDKVAVPSNGLFTVLLPVGKDGTENTIFAGQDLWLGIRIAPDQDEATPRQPLLYVPYAFWARNADKLSGKGSKWLPLAYGVIDRDTGGIVKGSGNFTSDWVDEGDPNGFKDYYEISITDVQYHLNDYVTVVTPISQKECPDPTVARTNSWEGKLIIEMERVDGVNVQCKFHFVTFKL